MVNDSNKVLLQSSCCESQKSKKDIVFFCFAFFLLIFVFARQFIPAGFSWFDDFILFLWLALLVFVRAIVNEFRVAKPPKSYVIFLTCCLIAWLLNFSFDRSVFQFQGFLVFVKNYFVIYAGFLIGFNFNKRVRLYKFFVLICLAPSVIILLQNLIPGMHHPIFMRDYGDVFVYLSFRKTAFFDNPGVVARLLGAAIIISLFLWRKFNYKRYLLVTALLLGGLTGTYSRMASIVLFFSLFLFVFFYYRSLPVKIYFLIFLLLVATAFFVFSPQWNERVREVNRMVSSVDEVYRVKSYIAAFSIFRDYPLFGTGPASFGSAIADKSESPVEEKYGFTTARLAYGEKSPTTSDAYWSHFIAEYGLVNLLLLFYLFYSIVAGSRFQEQNSDPDRGIIFILIFQAVINSISSFTLETASSGLVIMFFSGLFWGGSAKSFYSQSYYYIGNHRYRILAQARRSPRNALSHD